MSDIHYHFMAGVVVCYYFDNEVIFFNWKFSYVFNIFYGIKILLFFLFAVYHFKTKVMQEHFINLVVAVWGEDNDLML